MLELLLETHDLMAMGGAGVEGILHLEGLLFILHQRLKVSVMIKVLEVFLIYANLEFEIHAANLLNKN